MRPVTHIHPDTGLVIRSKVARATACGKQGYSSRKLAKSTAKIQAKATGEDLQAYHCPRGCHCWHIGHPPGSKNQVA